MKLFFVGWDLSKEDLMLANNIKSYFLNLIKQQNKSGEVTIQDIKTIGEVTYNDDCCVFGEMPMRYCKFTKHIWKMPSFADMRKSKKDGPEKKKEVADLLTVIATKTKVKEEDKQPEQETTTHVEIQGKSIGNSNLCDIQINKQEIEYLNRIKELLGGGTVVIKKGDIEIEVQ